MADGKSRPVDAVMSDLGMVFREEGLTSPLRQVLLLALRVVGTEEIARGETARGRPNYGGDIPNLQPWPARPTPARSMAPAGAPGADGAPAPTTLAI